MTIAILESTGGHRASLRLGTLVLPAVVGEAGIRADKEEGDRATPAGLLVLRRLFYRADRVAAPACTVPREPIGPEDGWCDDPAHADYNRRITLPHPARHEVLWRTDRLYDVAGVLGWNDDPVVRHRGSAIFLHLAPPGGAPTAGCIGLEPEALRNLLAAGLSGIAVRG